VPGALALVGCPKLLHSRRLGLRDAGESFPKESQTYLVAKGGFAARRLGEVTAKGRTVGKTLGQRGQLRIDGASAHRSIDMPYLPAASSSRCSSIRRLRVELTSRVSIVAGQNGNVSGWSPPPRGRRGVAAASIFHVHTPRSDQISVTCGECDTLHISLHF